MRNGREDSLPPRLCRGIRVLINKRGFVHRKITRAEIREGGVLGIRSYRISNRFCFLDDGPVYRRFLSPSRGR